MAEEQETIDSIKFKIEQEHLDAFFDGVVELNRKIFLTAPRRCGKSTCLAKTMERYMKTKKPEDPKLVYIGPSSSESDEEYAPTKALRDLFEAYPEIKTLDPNSYSTTHVSEILSTPSLVVLEETGILMTQTLSRIVMYHPNVKGILSLETDHVDAKNTFFNTYKQATKLFQDAWLNYNHTVEQYRLLDNWNWNRHLHKTVDAKLEMPSYKIMEKRMQMKEMMSFITADVTPVYEDMHDIAGSNHPLDEIDMAVIIPRAYELNSKRQKISSGETV